MTRRDHHGDEQLRAGVLFAGGTVIVALLGLVILNVGFLTGLGVAAAVTVFLTVMAAVTLLPALLATMGRRVLRRSERARALGRWHCPAPRQREMRG